MKEAKIYRDQLKNLENIVATQEQRIEKLKSVPNTFTKEIKEAEEEIKDLKEDFKKLKTMIDFCEKKDPEMKDEMMVAMKVKTVLVGCLLCVCVAGCVSCTWLNKKLGLRDDNIIEEAVEEAIKEETGLDVDMTPDSPE